MDREYKFTYKQRIKIITDCLTEGQTPDAGIFSNPIEYGYTLACQNALKLINDFLADYPADDEEYPLGRNDWQE